MFSLTRQMIIDDDLGALYDIPIVLASARRTRFPTRFGGCSSIRRRTRTRTRSTTPRKARSSPEIRSVSGLSAANAAFYKKTQPNGRPLNLRAKYLLVPPELMDAANVLMTAEMVNESTTADTPAANRNLHRGAYEILVSPYLSNSAFTGNSTTAYYLIADPNRIPRSRSPSWAGTTGRPCSRRTPTSRHPGRRVPGFLDFGVKEQDYRGILKVAGV